MRRDDHRNIDPGPPSLFWCRWPTRGSQAGRYWPVMLVVLAVGMVYQAWILHPASLPYSRSSDLFRHYLPFKQALYVLTQHLETIPAWDPWSQGGRPLLADPGAGAWYPLGVGFFLLPPDHQFTIFFLLHLAIGAFLTHTLLSRHGASRPAAAFGTLGYCLNLKLVATMYAGFATMIPAQAWLPGAFLGVQSLKQARHRWETVKATAGIAAVLAMQLLAGDTQLALYTFLALLPYGVLVAAPVQDGPGKSPGATMGFIGISGAGAILAAAPLIGLAGALTAVSTRAHGLSLAVAGTMSVPPSQLPAWLLPAWAGADRLGTWRGAESFWEVSFYPGLATWGLAALAVARFPHDRRIIPLAFLAFLGILFALGVDGPVFPVCYYLIPGIDRFRGPARILPLVALVVAMLGAIGLDMLKTLSPRATRRLACLSALAALLSLALAAWLLNHPSTVKDWFQTGEHLLFRSPTAGVDGYRALLWATLRSTGLSTVLTVATGLAAARDGSPFGVDAGRTGRGWLASVWLLVLAVDLAFTGHGHLEARAITEVLPPHPLAEDLAARTWRAAQPGANGAPGRILDVTGALPDLVVTRYGLHAVNGFNPLVLTRVFQYAEALAGRVPEIPAQRPVYGTLVDVVAEPRLLDLLRIRFVVTSAGEAIPGFQVRRIFRDLLVFQQFRGLSTFPALFLHERLSAGPAAWVVTHVEPEPQDKRRAFARLAEHDPYRGALLASPDRRPIEPGDSRDAWRPRTVQDLARSSHPEAEVAPVSVLAWRPDRVTLHVAGNPAGGWLILSDPWAPGWRATVDGVERPVYIADVVLRAVRLDPGPHEVVFRYDALGTLQGLRPDAPDSGTP